MATDEKKSTIFDIHEKGPSNVSRRMNDSGSTPELRLPAAYAEIVYD